MVGTNNGRVFMSGADGFLYELQYGNTDGWWQTYQTCSKRNRSRKRERAYQFLWSALRAGQSQEVARAPACPSTCPRGA